MTQGVVVPARARIVMIVDNVVDGDSRVQKTAMSAADAGYDVVLIGRSPEGRREEMRLGAATLVRLPQPLSLYGYRRRNPGRSLRWPLAYATRDKAVHQRRQLDAARRNLRDVTAQINVDIAQREASLFRRARKRPLKALALLAMGRNRRELTAQINGDLARSRSSFFRRVRRRPLKTLVLLRHLWYGLRTYEYNRASSHHKEPHGPIDDLSARAWRLVRGRGAWRRLDLLLTDYELVYGPEIDRLQPDLIHAHDFRMIGIAVRAAARATAAGRRCRVVYDAHEFMPGVRAHSLRWRLANEAHEEQYAPAADAVVTVSPRLAEMLQQRHRLRELPTVVLNAPSMQEPTSSAKQLDLRAACGVPRGTPLLVYSGSPAAQRGLATVVEALPKLPDVHVAFIVPGRPASIMELERRAVELDVADRLHVRDYVPQDQVVAFLRSADVGLVPILHQPNHEIALITKYFEYAHARLPLVVSDVETMARTTRQLGNGEVFTAGDVDGFAAATAAVLADPERYSKAYDQPGLLEGWSWETQAGVLLDLYARLLGSTPRSGQAAA